ncbi:MAG: NUDIX hydrolase [Pseudomonadales bacterium]|nr:NUDIX hydrolase [Pseudomonadales bacterium]
MDLFSNDKEAQLRAPSQSKYCDDYQKELRKTFWNSPIVSVDLGIFTLHKGKLKVLLVERTEHPWRAMWSLPGGFVQTGKDRSLEKTAERVLEQKTGVKSPYLRQWQAIGSEGRDARFWSVTVMFYALIRYVDVNESEGVRWFDVDGEHDIPSLVVRADLPAITKVKPAPDNDRNLKADLAFDHLALLKQLVSFLRKEVAYGILPAFMLPMSTGRQIYPEGADYFTLADLLRAYEIMMGTELKVTSIRRRFGVYGNSLKGESGGEMRQQQILETLSMDELEGFVRMGTGKIPAYYRLKKDIVKGGREVRFDSPLVGLGASNDE